MSNAENEKVTLVGAGLVGSLLSIYLARRGYRVEVYERRPDMRKENISAGRSINLAISTRGLHALRQVGLEEEVLTQAIPMRGRMIHPIQGEQILQHYGKDDSQCINSISRGWLNKVLMTRAEETGKVRIHFNEKAAAIDLRTGKLEVKNETSGQTRITDSTRVIGTDGSASAIRMALTQLPRHDVSQSNLAHGYKELVLPAGPGGSFRIEKHALHIWPRNSFMLIALPNFDGSFTCTLFLPFEGPVSFEQLQTPEAVTRFFKEQFPDFAAMMPNLTEEFFNHPVGHMMTLKTFPWSFEDKALLVGDAAHAIVPFFGQGMNCGFEDCAVFDECLEKFGSDWKKLFTEFPKLRKQHTDAIADMAVENFIEMRDKVGDPRFLLQKAVERILLNEFPAEFVSRYSLVSFSRTPYRLAYDIGAVTDEIMAELCGSAAKPEDVDLARARKLIQSRLAPLTASVVR